MARLEEKVKTQEDMEQFVISSFNGEEAIKKIDVRSYQGGYKIIIKTQEKNNEPIQTEAQPTQEA